MKKKATIYKQSTRKNKIQRKKSQQHTFKELFQTFVAYKGLFGILLLTLLFWYAIDLFPTASHMREAVIAPTKSPASATVLTDQYAKDISNEYATDLKEKKYTALWNLYALSYQKYLQSKVGKKEYLSFLQKKFSDITVQKYNLGTCKQGQTTFPYGIERQYQEVCSLPITYSLSSQNASVSAQLTAFSYVPLVLHKSDTKYTIVGGGPTDLQAPVVFPSVIKNQTDAVPVIMYHRIAPMPTRNEFNTDYGYKLDVGLTVTPQNFASQMDELQSRKYHPISPNDLFNNLYYNLPLPKNPILLTFDDGRLSDFTYGLPILEHHHFIATFFIPPYLSGKMFGLDNHNKYMSFAQLQILTTDGMYVENHSLKHDRPLWNIPPGELQSQLTTANTDLFQTTHYPIQFIAYPGRWPYANWNQIGPLQVATENVLTTMGFAMSFLDLGQNEAMENSEYPYQVPRIRPENMFMLSLKYP